ncbi:MAG: hypothetical protein D3924_14575 [Candidatus Electrothrix sp. AR4]|nr:hypothetical protein [Candidatus Electrothrix sp. AR4]
MVRGFFAFLRRDDERSACLDFSHRLIARLKREGLRRVHVGFSPLNGKFSSEEILYRGHLILSEAERRGPYSLCDEAFLNRKETHPFALPPAQILRGLQRKWFGLDRFGLLLIEFSGEGSGNNEVPDFTPLLPTDCFCISLSAHRWLFLFPEYTAGQVKKQVRQLALEIQNSTGGRPAMGYCHWPSVGLSKVDCVRKLSSIMAGLIHPELRNSLKR